MRASGVVSILIHAAAVAAVAVTVVLMGPGPESAPRPAAAQGREPLQLPRMIFLPKSGPSRGGGGGGNRQPSPASRAQAIGRDRATIPVGKPVVSWRAPKDGTPAPPGLALAVKPLASGTSLLIGLPDAPTWRPFSQGPGVGGGVGDGRGTGIGSGTGPGIGPGSGGGFGGGAYRLGSGGVVAPTVVKEVKPKYTSAALRDRIEGSVLLEVVVGRDGHPHAIRVIRPLDPGGLDEEAVLAARGWRFTPGRVGDTPVDVLVTIQVDFHIR